MPNTIDWKFIAALEGAGITQGYVPLPDTSQSGVTIASGFDLGQHSAGELNNLNLSAALTKKLKPYLGLTKHKAVEFLKKHPLTITKQQAQEIDKAVKNQEVIKLKSRYLSSTFNKNKIQFDDLPSQAQTVIASISFQYGDLASRRVFFWKAVSIQDWKEAVKVLRGYATYRPRRHKEADLLEQLVKFEKKIAEFLPAASIWKLLFIMIPLFGSISLTARARSNTVIFDGKLAAAYKNYDRSAAEKRKTLQFESGEEVTNCLEYWREKNKSAIKDETANMLYASEYMICDALQILKEAEKSNKKLPKDKTTANYGREIYNRLNLCSFPSSICESSDDKRFFKNLMPKNRSKFTKYAASLSTPKWNFTVKAVAETDFDGDGKRDWILWVVDEALKEGNYRNYSTILILDAAKKGVLEAEVR